MRLMSVMSVVRSRQAHPVLFHTGDDRHESLVRLHGVKLNIELVRKGLRNSRIDKRIVHNVFHDSGPTRHQDRFPVVDIALAILDQQGSSASRSTETFLGVCFLVERLHEPGKSSSPLHDATSLSLLDGEHLA